MTSIEIHSINNLCNDIINYSKKLYNYYFTKECMCECCIKAKNN